MPGDCGSVQHWQFKVLHKSEWAAFLSPTPQADGADPWDKPIPDRAKPLIHLRQTHCISGMGERSHLQ